MVAVVVRKNDEKLIRLHIEEHPLHPGPANARLVDTGAEVWLIVAYAKNVGGNLDHVAQTYGVSLEAVRAACAYYDNRPELIDARIALEHSAFS